MARSVTVESWSPYESAFRRAASVERLRRYRQRNDKGAWAPAIARYQFNIALGRSLYPLFHASEVTLRNHLFDAVQEAYPNAISSGKNADGHDCLGCWLDDAAMTPSLLPREMGKVRDARIELHWDAKHRGVSSSLTAGHLVAALRLGFWTRLLDPEYADWRVPQHLLWSNRLHDLTFPYCPDPPGRRRGVAHTRFTTLKQYRNRVFHHEHIRGFTIDRYDHILEAVSWISAETATTLRELDRPRVKLVLDRGYEPFRAALESLINRHFPDSRLAS